MALSDIVNVQISTVSESVSRVGFGVPLILTYHTKDAARVLEFADAPSMLVAGGGPFASSDLAYILASKAFSQNPKPNRVLVGRRVNPTIRTFNLTPRSGTINGETYPLPNTDYSVTIARDGTEETFTHPSGATPTVAAIVTALTGFINAGGVDVLATDNTTDMDVEAAATPGGAATAGTPFTISYDRSLFEGEDQTPVAAGGDLAGEIAAIRNINDEWYGLVGDWWGATEIEDAAGAIETLYKIHVCASADDGIYDSGVTTDPASVLSAANYARTSVFHHPTPETGIAAAHLGKNLPKDPGSITWKFKTLAGITTESYTPAEEAVLVSKNCERYVEIAGASITCDGKTSSGEFMDVTRFMDWLKARMEENIFAILAASDKVPYTDQGVGIVESEVYAVLNEGIAVGGLAADPAPTVSVPLVADVDPVDRANRLLPDVKFNAQLAGAIHAVEVTGIITI